MPGPWYPCKLLTIWNKYLLIVNVVQTPSCFGWLVLSYRKEGSCEEFFLEVREEGTDQKLHDSLDISLGEVFRVGVKGLPIFGVVILRRHSPSAHAMRVKQLSRNYRLTPLSRQCISRRFSVWHMPRTHSCFPILQLKRSKGVWQKTTLFKRFFVPFP